MCEADRLLDEAIDLVIRLQNDPDNSVTTEMIRSWRARSTQHEDAWARVFRIHGASGEILHEKQRIERRHSLDPTRRRFMIGGITVLGAGAATYAFGPDMILEARADYFTGKGEIRRIELPDGSKATLGPESAIAVDFKGQSRNVDLLAGMSFFEVAGESMQLFSVRSGGFRITALGSAFDISNDTGVLASSVDRGRITIEASAPGALPTFDLSEGEWATVDPADGTLERGRRETGQIASWRDNTLIAERDTVAVLVARIGRWLPGRIIVADSRIGRQRINGIFDLSDPRRALRAVVRPTGAHVRQISSLVTIISPV